MERSKSIVTSSRSKPCVVVEGVQDCGDVQIYFDYTVLYESDSTSRNSLYTSTSLNMVFKISS